MAFWRVVMGIIACSLALHSPAWAETTLEELCGACTVEVFAKGGKFLEGPAFDTAGNLWVVSIQSGAVSQITPDGTWTEVFNTGGQPQGLKFHKDGRLFGVDRKRGVFSYDPKTQKLSSRVGSPRKGPEAFTCPPRSDPWCLPPAPVHRAG
jgi:gluconolactonase